MCQVIKTYLKIVLELKLINNQKMYSSIRLKYSLKKLKTNIKE